MGLDLIIALKPLNVKVPVCTSVCPVLPFGENLCSSFNILKFM
jgi:hypothetical protein